MYVLKRNDLQIDYKLIYTYFLLLIYYMYFASWNHCSSNRICLRFFSFIQICILCCYGRKYYRNSTSHRKKLASHFYSFEYIVTVKCMLHLLIYFSFPCDQSKLWTYKIDLKIHRVNIFHPYTMGFFCLGI
jgi:hypothetical protein